MIDGVSGRVEVMIYSKRRGRTKSDVFLIDCPPARECQEQQPGSTIGVQAH